jgi:hypothetical protein
MFKTLIKNMSIATIACLGPAPLCVDLGVKTVLIWVEESPATIDCGTD